MGMTHNMKMNYLMAEAKNVAPERYVDICLQLGEYPDSATIGHDQRIIDAPCRHKYMPDVTFALNRGWTNADASTIYIRGRLISCRKRSNHSTRSRKPSEARVLGSREDVTRTLEKAYAMQGFGEGTERHR